MPPATCGVTSGPHSMAALENELGEVALDEERRHLLAHVLGRHLERLLEG